MKKLLLGLMLIISGSAFSQVKKGKDKEVDVYTTYVMGTIVKIEIPSSKQVVFLGRSFDDAGKGTWYLCSDPNLISQIESLTANGDTAVLVGAELPPFQTFTPKQWKQMKKAMKRAFPREAHAKLDQVPWIVLTSVYKYTKPKTGQMSQPKPVTTAVGPVIGR